MVHMFALLLLAAAATLPKPFVELVDRARSVPPEFGADALLRMAESEAVTDTAAKRELIEEAFRLAGAAQEPMKRRGIRPGSADSHVNFLARAYAQDLDTLSLQSRAVADMLRIDKRKARDLFARIAPPRVPKLACADLLVYDVSAYFEAAGEIAKTAFTPKERAAQDHAKFLAGFAGRISSAAEVGPMARAIAAAGFTPEPLQMLLTVFTASLQTLAADDRSFSFTASGEGAMMADIAALVSAAKGQQVSSVALVEGVRGYLVRHLTATRCFDNSGMTIGLAIGNQNPAEQPGAVAYFNGRIRAEVYPADSKIEPLGGEEIRANGLEDPVPPQETSWHGQESRDLADRFNGLLFNPAGTAWPGEYKNGAEWLAKLREYLGALGDWRPGDVGPAEYFYRKCYLLSSLVNVAPNGPPRERVLRAYVDFLRQNTYQQTSRIEWFLPVNTLLVRVTMDPSLAALAEELRHAGDPVMAMYAQLDKTVPRSPAKVMGLL
jgi:hypothetical protein